MNNSKCLSFYVFQAFLEMVDEGAAATMVTYYASSVAQLRGRAVYVQFSNHRELKTDQTHNNAAGSPTNAIANTSNVSIVAHIHIIFLSTHTHTHTRTHKFVCASPKCFCASNNYRY